MMPFAEMQKQAERSNSMKDFGFKYRITLALVFACVLAAGVQAFSGGVLKNGSHSTVGYVEDDGTVKNSSHSTIGYFQDGTVKNSSHTTIGYINEDGTIKNSSHSTIGYYEDVEPVHAAAFFFFFFKSEAGTD